MFSGKTFGFVPASINNVFRHRRDSLFGRSFASSEARDRGRGWRTRWRRRDGGRDGRGRAARVGRRAVRG